MKIKFLIASLIFFSANLTLASEDKSKAEKNTQKFMDIFSQLIVGNFKEESSMTYGTRGDIIFFQAGLTSLVGNQRAYTITSGLHKRSCESYGIEKASAGVRVANCNFASERHPFSIGYLRTRNIKAYNKAFWIYNHIYPKVVKQHPNLIGKIDSPLEILGRTPWLALDEGEASKRIKQPTKANNKS